MTEVESGRNQVQEEQKQVYQSLIKADDAQKQPPQQEAAAAYSSAPIDV
jgi:hypothetical protein